MCEQVLVFYLLVAMVNQGFEMDVEMHDLLRTFFLSKTEASAVLLVLFYSL